MTILPREIIDKIALYLPFEKMIHISNYSSLIAYNNPSTFIQAEYNCLSAVNEGNLDVLKWHYKNGLLDYTLPLGDYAAYHGYFNIVKWLYETNPICFSDVAIQEACYNDHFDIVKWLVNKGIPYDSHTLGVCLFCDKIEIFDWLYNLNPDIKIEFYNENSLLEFIDGGITTVNYIIENDCVQIKRQDFSACIIGEYFEIYEKLKAKYPDKYNEYVKNELALDISHALTNFYKVENHQYFLNLIKEHSIMLNDHELYYILTDVNMGTEALNSTKCSL
jgi:hypothetical protein